MPDPSFDVSRYYAWTDKGEHPKVEFVIWSPGVSQRTTLSPGNAILLAKALQREAEAILKERKK